MLQQFHSSRGTFASVQEDNRLKIWDVKSGSLLLELCENDHLAYKYTSMAWSTSSVKKSRKAKSDSSRSLGLIALGTDNGVIIVWDLQLGEILYKLENGKSHLNSINDVVFDTKGTRLYSTSSEKYIYEWDMKDGNCLRKIKFGKGGATRIAICPKSNILAAANSSIKLFDISSGKKSMTLTAGHASSISFLSFCSSGRYIFSSAIGDRFINAYDCKSENTDPILIFSLESSPLSYSFHIDINLNPIICTIAASCENENCYIWRVPIEEKTNEKKRIKNPETQISLSREEASNEFTSQIFNICLESKEDQILLARGNPLKPVFETIKFVDNKHQLIKEIFLTKLSQGLLLENKKAKITNIEPEFPVYTADKGIQQSTILIDSEYQSNDGINIIKKKKKDEELLTLAERVKALEESIEHERKETKQIENLTKPIQLDSKVKLNAGSVITVLEQALQSKDDDMLESCISISDLKCIEATVERLSSTRVLDFLNRIVNKFEAEPSRGSTLCLWIKSLLMKHTAYLMTIPDLVKNLSKLYQTLEMRLGVVQDLWKLSGRLDLVLAQISERAVSVEHEQENVPAYVYNDDDDYLEGNNKEDIEEDDEENKLTLEEQIDQENSFDDDDEEEDDDE